MHTKCVLQLVITKRQNLVNLHIKDELKYLAEELIKSLINSRQLRYTCTGIKNQPGYDLNSLIQYLFFDISRKASGSVVVETIIKLN